jgi:hypothetical protein
MERMLETAFAPKDEEEPGDTDVVAELAADARPDDVSAQRSAVESLLPIASAGTANRAQWVELAWRSAAVLCAAATGGAGDPPEDSLQVLSTLAPERSAEGVPSPLQTTLGFSDDEAKRHWPRVPPCAEIWAA